MSDKLLMVFIRNTELGKVKTRLAKTIGDQSALNIYNYLLEHTEHVLKSIDCAKAVFYSNAIENHDLWDSANYHKCLQHGDDLGAKMNNAFQFGFNEKYSKVIIVGSDLPDLNKYHINKAFEQLDNYDMVIGPAKDGGYYLLGMKKMNESIFKNKDWGTDSVFRDTMNDLKNENVFLLDVLNDVDTYQDIEDNNELKKLI